MALLGSFLNILWKSKKVFEDAKILQKIKLKK